MPDNLNIIAPEDKTKVNVNQDHELEYWSKKFGCTKTQLLLAVAKVGFMAKDVEAYLKR